MKQLNIEWKHFDEKGETCLRCSDTGKTLQKVVSELSNDLKSQGIEINFIETKLSQNEIAESNAILFNGKNIEEIITDMNVQENFCLSCSNLIRKETCCRSIEYKGQVFEEIPEDIIKKAILITIDKMRG